jgi:DNA (cytosine-5)-methyltransferase 1
MRTELLVDDWFSCIGGHALGLHNAGGFKTVRFIEIDEWRRTILKKHFPDVPQHDDVLTAKAIQADVLIGGPPCKNTSVAAAIHDKRTGNSLWDAMYKAVREGSYEWIVVEQPPGNKAWEDKVISDLAGAGYRCTRNELSASDFGAPHTRKRVFMLAHCDIKRLSVARKSITQEVARLKRTAFAGGPWYEGVPRTLRVDDGVPSRVDRKHRITAIGDSNPPIMATVIGLGIKESVAW